MLLGSFACWREPKELVMPRQKDLKRIVRSRMLKTGESYSTARLHLIKGNDPPAAEYAAVAGMSDASVEKATGRDWAGWVRALDAVQAAEKSHSQIAAQVSSLGAGSWWSQMVTVGYERIRGLRERGQLRAGTYSISKSRTFPVAVEQLYKAFASARLRARWLPAKMKVRTSIVPRSIRVTWEENDTDLHLAFYAKGPAKSSVALAHQKLPDKATAEKMKAWWAERLDALGALFEN
jgi:hypothetical protein